MALTGQKGDGKAANVCTRFKRERLNGFQQKAINQIVGKKDIFIKLPTGFGKSLVYQTLPMIFDHLTGSGIVVSSLINKSYESTISEKSWGDSRL